MLKSFRFHQPIKRCPFCYSHVHQSSKKQNRKQWWNKCDKCDINFGMSPIGYVECINTGNFLFDYIPHEKKIQVLHRYHKEYANGATQLMRKHLFDIPGDIMGSEQLDLAEKYLLLT